MGLYLLIADAVALVVANYAFGANESLAILAEILGLLLRVLQTELFSEVLLALSNGVLGPSHGWTHHAERRIIVFFVVNVIYANSNKWLC